MASSFQTFRIHTPPYSQFRPYSGFKTSEPSSRRCPMKITPPSVQEWHNIDEIPRTELGPNHEPENAMDLATTFHEAEVVDLTCLDGEINYTGGTIAGSAESVLGHIRSGGVSSNEDNPRCDHWATLGREYSRDLEEFSIETMDESLNQPATVERSNKENVVVTNSDSTKPGTKTNDDEHRPQEDNTDTQTDNRHQNVGMLTMECLSEDSSLTSMDGAPGSEMFERADIPISLHQSREPTSPPCKSTVKNSQCRIICDDEANKTTHFPNEVSMTNHSIGLPSDPISSYNLIKATTDQPRSTVEKKTKRQNEFLPSESASSSSHGDSDGTDAGDDDSDNSDGGDHTYDTLLTRKRVPPTNIISRKRHGRTSDTTPKQYPGSAARSAKRPKPSTLRGIPLSGHLSVSKPVLGAKCGSVVTEDVSYGTDSSDESSEERGNPGRQLQSNERAESISSSVWPSRSNITFSPSTYTSPHATGETSSRPSAKGVSPPRQAQRHLPDVTLHPLSADRAFLTAFVPDCGDMRPLSTTQAVEVLEKALSHPTELRNITVKPLALGAYLLTCYVFYPSNTADFRMKTAPQQKSHKRSYVQSQEALRVDEVANMVALEEGGEGEESKKPAKRVRAVRRCKNCRETGHDSRTCTLDNIAAEESDDSE